MTALIVMAVLLFAPAAGIADGQLKVSSGRAHATASPTSAPSPKASATPLALSSPSPPPAKPFVLSGYADVGLTDVFRTDKVRFKNGNQSRIFDGAEGPFANPLNGKLYARPYDFNAVPDLQNLNLQAHFNGALGGVIETSFGSDADFIASFGQPRSSFNLTQAYARYTHSSLTYMAGKFESLAGFEAIESPRNLDYSHGYLPGYAVPGTHTGVRLTYARNAELSVSAGVNDGWDDWTFVGKGLTFEGAVAFTPSPRISLSLATYNGKDYSGQFLSSGHPYGNRMVYDVIVTDHPTNVLQLTANYDDGTQLDAARVDGAGATVFVPGTATPMLGSDHWSGLAVYAAYTMTPRFRLVFRAETFHDGGGFRTGYDQRLQSRTVTLAYSSSKQETLRLEYRTDLSDHPVFQQLPNLATTPGRGYQNAIGVEDLITF